MAAHPITSVSVTEYLQIDSEAERPSEYFDGTMFPVQAASENHAALTVNLIVAVTNRLRAKKSLCRAYSQNLRVYLPNTKEYAYPDLVMACGEPLLAPYDTLLNPVLIAEVLSPATQNYDLGNKFALYRSIPSLKEYWTIAQDQICVQQWTIRDGHWTLIEHTSRPSKIIHPQFELSLDEVYFELEFMPRSTPEPPPASLPE